MKNGADNYLPQVSDRSGEDQIGFSLLNMNEGESRLRSEEKYNTLVFILDGAIMFSYNDYLYRRFEKDDIFFIPKAADMYGKALADTEILIIKYDNRSEMLYDTGILSICTHIDASRVEYDFKPLKVVPVLSQFLGSVRSYMMSDVRNSSLYELKLRELFVIMVHCYTDREIVQLFHPVLGKDFDFRSRILEVSHEDLSVEEFAERFNMSPRNFSRKFKHEFGQSVHQWMLERKSKRIQLRLAMPQTTINDIINEFGFTSSSYFWEYCRRHFNCTPQELIRKVRNPIKVN